METEQPLHVEIRYLTDQAMALDMRGDLTRQSEEAVLQLRPWADGLDGRRKYLILNLTQVPYINSAGIAVLIRLARAGIKGGFTTFAYGVTPHYEKLFRMVGLTEYMLIYPEEYSILERVAAMEA
jgi:stage II sporulation protein AA (anti-sigma F factor antagonist)